MSLLLSRIQGYCYHLSKFHVDHFVSDCRKRVQLEALRDDLELYYKLLKTAMVELINKDYADFVNLSTNLVNLKSTLLPVSVFTHVLHTFFLFLSTGSLTSLLFFCSLFLSRGESQ